MGDQERHHLVGLRDLLHHAGHVGSLRIQHVGRHDGGQVLRPHAVDPMRLRNTVQQLEDDKNAGIAGFGKTVNGSAQLGDQRLWGFSWRVFPLGHQLNQRGIECEAEERVRQLAEKVFEKRAGHVRVRIGAHHTVLSHADASSHVRLRRRDPEDALHLAAVLGDVFRQLQQHFGHVVLLLLQQPFQGDAE